MQSNFPIKSKFEAVKKSKKPLHDSNHKKTKGKAKWWTLIEKQGRTGDFQIISEAQDEAC